MGLKNTAMKFFWSDDMEEQQEEYTRTSEYYGAYTEILCGRARIC